jgi:hypothetical protein
MIQPPIPPDPPDGDQAKYLKRVVYDSNLTDEQKLDLLKSWVPDED